MEKEKQDMNEQEDKDVGKAWKTNSRIKIRTIIVLIITNYKI